eukprot:224163_1
MYRFKHNRLAMPLESESKPKLKMLYYVQRLSCRHYLYLMLLTLCYLVINSFHVTNLMRTDNDPVPAVTIDLNTQRHLLGQSAEDIRSLIEGTYDDIHMVVTTGCSGYQNWQFETLVYSWSTVKQPGRFTRIIAGCKTDEERIKANTTAIPNDDHRILFYFVDDYSPDLQSGGRPFWYFNKPYGFNEWLFDDTNMIYESVIVLIDPDFLILKPFLFHIPSEAHKVAQELAQTSPERKNGKRRVRDLWVRKGHPVSQKYGIGAKWVRGNWTGFCDDTERYGDTDCQSKDERYVWEYYSIGPPYMMHIDDWKLISPKWIEFSPNALKWDPPPSILAEMYSFVIACAMYNLKHEYLLSMVSHPDSNEYMENTYDIDIDNMNEFKFHVLHYCHGYWLGKERNHGTIRNGGWNFHKGHVPVNYLYDCDIPLLTQIDHDLDIFKARDASKIEDQYGMVWILNVMTKRINEAVLNYRMRYCNYSDEWKPEYTLVLQQPESDTSARRMNYILANYKNGKSWKGA